MTNYSQTFLNQVVETSLLNLMAELEEVTGVKRSVFLNNSTLAQYIQQCVRPNGANTMQILIDKRALDTADPINSFLLRKSIKKLHDTEIFWLCDEIVRYFGDGESIEQVEGKALYTFINYYFKDSKRKKKRKSTNLWK